MFDLVAPLTVCRTANCFWKSTIIHTFNGYDGEEPGYGDLVWDKQGNIYGVTSQGGTSSDGVVFQLTPSGNTWTETPIHIFQREVDGGAPYGGLVVDGNGNLFGTTELGPDGGIVFELSYVVGVGWNETILFTFQDANAGGLPVGGMIFDKSGNLYGTTSALGTAGGGTVFELSRSGDTWTYQVLYSFVGDATCGPQESLSMDAAGNLYGTTRCDGANKFGNVFKLTNTGNGWSYASLHDFTGKPEDGRYPYSNVTIDTDGTLYGTADGLRNDGIVWMIKP